MSNLTPDALEPWLRRDSNLRSADHLPKLVPSRPGGETRPLLERLRAFSVTELGKVASSATDGIALRAGLFQWHDFLDECHELAQSIEGEGRHRLGDYWHAIMHRREPDYSNAKYWFRHVGRNPVFEPLGPQAAGILDSGSANEGPEWSRRIITRTGWDPFAFVDLCELCANDEDAPLAVAARKIQLAEMALLIDFTYRQCLGV